MAARKLPWCRLYSGDFLSDRKLARICRASGLCKAIVRGWWSTLLALANDSPERGSLMLEAGIPVDEDEICDDLGLDPQAFDSLMDEAENLKMIDRGPPIVIINFLKRNPESDSSTDRVRRHRARQKAQSETTKGNVTETLQERSSHGVDTYIESDPDSESDPEDNSSPPQAADELAPSDALTVFEEQYGPFKQDIDREAIRGAVCQHGDQIVIRAIQWLKGRKSSNVIQAILTAANTFARAPPPSDNGRGDRSSNATLAAIRELEAEVNGGFG